MDERTRADVDEACARLRDWIVAAIVGMAAIALLVL